MARVARRAGQRGRTIPARLAARSGAPGRDARLATVSSSERGHWGLRRTSRACRESTRGVGAGATDSRNHRRRSTGVPGRVPRGRRRRVGRRRPTQAAPAAKVSLDRGRRRDRRLARRAPADRRHRRQARRRHGRRRRRRRRGRRRRAGRRSSRAAAVWTPKDQLAYGTSYTLTATAKNAADKETKASSTLHHRHARDASPRRRSARSSGTTVGVGMPIRVYFDDPVADKAAVESHLKVTTSTPTDGVWSWMNDSEVHFRPSQYWPAEHPRHPRREPLRRELRRRHLGREEPLGVLRHRRQARLGRRRRRAHAAPSTTATRSRRPTR